MKKVILKSSAIASYTFTGSDLDADFSPDADTALSLYRMDDGNGNENFLSDIGHFTIQRARLVMKGLQKCPSNEVKAGTVKLDIQIPGFASSDGDAKTFNSFTLSFSRWNEWEKKDIRIEGSSAAPWWNSTLVKSRPVILTASSSSVFSLVDLDIDSSLLSSDFNAYIELEIEADNVFEASDVINVEKSRENAERADIVFVDGDGNIRFIQAGTLVASSIPDTWTSVGFVSRVKDGKALILHKEESSSVKFASCWKWEISGIKYGEENTIQFCQRKSDNTNIDIGDPLTFTPEDMDAAVTAIDTFLRANAGGSSAGAGWNYSWHCEKLPNYLGEDAVIVVADNIADYRQYNSIINATGTTAGITSKTNMCDFLTAYGYSSMLRNNGGSGYRPGIVYDRMLEYYATNTTIANPTTMVSTSNGSDIVSKEQFEENQYCADLRAEYGTFEKYIESIMLKWPSSEGAQADLDGTGKTNTYLLDACSHHLLDGTETKDYTAVAWAAAKSFDAEGLGAGCWYMPDIIEMLDIFGPMKTDGSDALNMSVKALTGSPRSVAVARWSPARYSNTNAWSLNASGSFYTYSFSSSYGACCVALLDLAP